MTNGIAFFEISEDDIVRYTEIFGKFLYRQFPFHFLVFLETFPGNSVSFVLVSKFSESMVEWKALGV